MDDYFVKRLFFNLFLFACAAIRNEESDGDWRTGGSSLFGVWDSAAIC